MNTLSLRRYARILCFALLAAALLAGCATTDRSAAGKPRLIVFFVVDGLPQRQVVDYRDQLGADGLARFLERGAWFAEAHYGHAYAVTAAGHATMLTGAYPRRTGIIGNEWRDRATAEAVYCTGDESSTYLDNKTEKLAGTSPKNLQVETVGDVLTRMDPRAKMISLSGLDYINHAYGAESRLSHEHLLRLDRMLEAFFADLDRTVGKDNYVAVLTADHGFMPAPEYSISLGRDAGRQNIPETLARLNDGLAAKFGTGKWARTWSANGVLLDNALIAQKRVDRRALEQEARRILLTERGIAEVFSSSDLAATDLPAGTPFLAQMRYTCYTYYADRSPDLLVVAKPYWMFEARRTATSTHGSPHAYDDHVPILFYGPRWAGTGRVETPVAVIDIAPTLARLLGVTAPAASEGKLLPLP